MHDFCSRPILTMTMLRKIDRRSKQVRSIITTNQNWTGERAQPRMYQRPRCLLPSTEDTKRICLSTDRMIVRPAIVTPAMGSGPGPQMSSYCRSFLITILFPASDVLIELMYELLLVLGVEHFIQTVAFKGKCFST